MPCFSEVVLQSLGAFHISTKTICRDRCGDPDSDWSTCCLCAFCEPEVKCGPANEGRSLHANRTRCLSAFTRGVIPKPILLARRSVSCTRLTISVPMFTQVDCAVIARNITLRSRGDRHGMPTQRSYTSVNGYWTRLSLLVTLSPESTCQWFGNLLFLIGQFALDTVLDGSSPSLKFA